MRSNRKRHSTGIHPVSIIIQCLSANALDIWFEVEVKRACRGEAHIVRYADDYVCCFQYKNDAERFYQALF